MSGDRDREQQAAFTLFWSQFGRQLRNEVAHGVISPDVAAARIKEAGWDLSWEDLYEVARTLNWEQLGRPPHLLALLSELGAALEIESAVDPWVVSPAVIGSLSAADAGRRLLGVTPNPEVALLARRIAGQDVEWLVGNPSTLAAGLEEHFDWIVSSPPIGLTARGPEGEPPEGLDPQTVRQESGLLAVANALRPETKGIVVLLTEKFLWDQRSQGWLDFFRSKGLQLSATVSVAEGLAPSTSIPTLLCTFTRDAQEDVFVARVTPTTDAKAVAQGLVARRAARVPELGVLVAPGTFQGWESFSARLTLERRLKRSRVPLVPLGELTLAERSGKAAPGGEPEAASNALYFDSRVIRAVTTMPPAPRGDAKQPIPYVVLELDPERVNADFVASWLNGSDGRLVLESLAVGTAMRRIPRKELGRITVPVPPLVDQSRTVKLGTRLSGLRQEVENLEGQLWSEPWSVGDIEDELGRLTEGDPLRAWVERLPFPLAVTLIRYMADADEEQKVKRLLYFFEACAEFCVIALLSALKRDPSAWEDEKDALRAPGPSGRHPLSEGQFGGWVHLGRHLAKVFRGRLNGAGDDDRRTAFGVAAKTFIDPLIGKDLWAKLDEARVIRNERGHGGEWSPADMRQRLEGLERILGELRDLSNKMFAQVVLVQPGSSDRGHGIRRYRRARYLAGPLSTFMEREIVAQAHVDLIGDGLCFIDRTEVIEDALELIPLVRLMPSPGTEQNAAFFFNKIEGGSMKFVSYHFPGETEAPLDDPGLAAVVKDILGS